MPSRMQRHSQSHNGLKDIAKTRESLEQFFHFSPSTNTIDPAKFDAEFVKQFKDVRATMERESSVKFESVYSGYLSFADETPRERPIAQWGDGPDLLFLGTSEEKAAWKRLRDDEQRRKFIEDFWHSRDHTPDTDENEFRRGFLRRVSFADHTFVTEQTRGSLTDRGRVFVLLGPPRIVRQGVLSEADGGSRDRRQRGPVGAGSTGNLAEQARAMQASDNRLGTPTTNPVVKGKVERWVYGRSQLPKSFPDDQVVFKFITEEGYGENVLQRDFMALKVLIDARVDVTST